MKFDWLSFFKTYGIDYIEEGPNVKHGNLNIHCIFCGHLDPSHHLGCDPETGFWGCWRNPNHRGKSPVWLIQALLRCSKDEAQALVADQPVARTPFDAMRATIDRLQGQQDPAAALPSDPPIEFPDDFRWVGPKGTPARFARYLVDERGFGQDEIPNLVGEYGLRCALTGSWAWRLILPFVVNQKLQGWTGRAIAPSQNRYLSYPSSAAVKRLVFNHDATLDGGRVLVIVEGAMGSVKVDFYGQREGIRCVGTLGTAVVDKQVAILLGCAKRFDQTLILFDPGAYGPARDLASRMVSARPKIGRLPSQYGGPDDLEPNRVIPFISSQL
jgi:hypothetical protein